jgi:hypothetical protein
VTELGHQTTEDQTRRAPGRVPRGSLFLFESLNASMSNLIAELAVLLFGMVGPPHGSYATRLRLI